VRPEVPRDSSHMKGMLAHAQHRHNPESHIGDECLICGKQGFERDASLCGGDPQRGAFTQHHTAHDARHTTTIETRRQHLAIAHEKHIAHGARDHVPGTIEQQRVKGALRCNLGSSHHVLEPAQMFDAGQRGIVCERDRRPVQRDACRNRSRQSGFGPQRQEAPRRFGALGCITPAYGAATRNDDLEHCPRWRQHQRSRDLGTQLGHRAEANPEARAS